VVLDFSGLPNTQAKTYYSELALRQLWADIEAGRRSGITIVLDEAHRVTKQEHSIIHIMSKEIRHRGRLIVVTQALSEIREASLQNFASILCFKTGSADLSIVRGINPILHHALSQLSAYEFIDIQFPRFSEYVPVFKFVAPIVEVEVPPLELEPKPDLHQEVRKQQKEEEKAASVEVGQSASGGKGDGAAGGGDEQKPKEKVVIAEEELTSLFPAYQKDVINKLAEKHNDVPYNDVKFAVSQTLKKLVNSGIAGTIRIEEFEEQSAFSFCYLRGSNVSQLHSYLQAKTRDAIGRVYKIEHYATSGEFSNPDLETKGFNFEIETGLSNNNTKNLERRLTETLKQEPGKSEVVIVPNEDQEAKYTKHLLAFVKEYPNRISILTLRELKNSLKDMRTSARPLKADEKESENALRKKEEGNSDAFV
jgi:hypothetical protein